jgi:hypothetical protein
VLALANLASLQSAGGSQQNSAKPFYWNPTFVTSVEIMPLYIVDENMHLVPPDDNHAFCERIKYVLNNNEYALTVAEMEITSLRYF